MYSALAPLVGALITLMNGLNSRLSAITGNLVAALAIHVAGLVAVSIVLLARREPRRVRQAGLPGLPGRSDRSKPPDRLPFYYYLGGFIGVGTVFSNNYAFGILGASLAVALALLGQTLCSVAIDAAGFLGRKKYPLSLRSLPGLALALSGVMVMAGGRWRADILAMMAALVSGAIPALSFTLNSELGRRTGVLRSTRTNYIVGLATTLAIVAAMRPDIGGSLRSVVAAGPFLALGGGTMGVVVVTSMNLIFPRIKAFSATLLVFSGQALAGILIDYAKAGNLELRKLLGTLLLLAGLAINSMLLKRSAERAK
ncbi:MAG TPA: DMT family transporter [Rectinemataceae bacterium]|nr:DMT family transporter [Rectinemataceae bacterium]